MPPVFTDADVDRTFVEKYQYGLNDFYKAVIKPGKY